MKEIINAVLIVIACIILILIASVFIISGKNMKSMNHCIDAVLKELKEHYTMIPLDIGDYKTMKLNSFMKFNVEQYDTKELGNLSIMRVNMGVMQMATIVITPREKNMPLLSADYMYILSNRKSYLEFYDVVEEKDAQYQQLLTSLSNVLNSYQQLENTQASPAWYEHLLTTKAYKKGSSKNDLDMENMLLESLKTYISHSNQLPVLSANEKASKLAITVNYTDGLIEKGGISTDVFKKSLGNEETKKFFDNIFFCTAMK